MINLAHSILPTHTLFLILAIILMAGILLFLVLGKKMAGKKKAILADQNDNNTENNKLNKKSGLSIDKSAVIPEKEYHRRMSSKKFRTRKRMFNYSRKNCRGKK